MQAVLFNGAAQNSEPLPSRLQVRDLSSLCFPVLYQMLFTYLMTIADLVGPTLGKSGFVLFAGIGILASSLSTLWLLKSKHIKTTYIRLALPLLIALLLPISQIVLLTSHGNSFR